MSQTNIYIIWITVTYTYFLSAGDLPLKGPKDLGAFHVLDSLPVIICIQLEERLSECSGDIANY